MLKNQTLNTAREKDLPNFTKYNGTKGPRQQILRLKNEAIVFNNNEDLMTRVFFKNLTGYAFLWYKNTQNMGVLGQCPKTGQNNYKRVDSLFISAQ